MLTDCVGAICHKYVHIMVALCESTAAVSFWRGGKPPLALLPFPFLFLWPHEKSQNLDFIFF